MPTKLIRKHLFKFDKKGLKLYEKEFKDNNFEIILYNDYLARRNNKKGIIEFFHIWFYNRIKPSQGKQIHHINTENVDNSFSNLIDITEKEHKILHEYQIRTQTKFKTKSEIREFLRNISGQKILFQIGEKATKDVNKESNPRKKEYLKARDEIGEERVRKEREKMLKEWERDENSKKKKPKIKSKTNNKTPIGKIIITLFIVAGLIYILNIYADSNQPNPSTKPIINENVPEQIESIIVKGSKTDVIIENNLEKSISLNVTYRIYSKWFGADYQQSEIFEVGANKQESFTVYNNDGCSTAPCSVSVINYKEIEN
jgi:hypothetical protein